MHPLLTLIITMELSVFCFFFIIYTFAINRYMPFILWPISVSGTGWGCLRLGCIHAYVLVPESN